MEQEIDERLNVDSKMKIEDFTLLKVIGKGSYATVMLCTHNETDEVYAIKMLDKNYLVEQK